MSRISFCNNQAISHWVKTNQELIQKYPGWHENIDGSHGESLLAGKAPFTYLLRKGDKENAYFITFVKEDLTIKHQLFTLEEDSKGWYYKNGGHDSGTISTHRSTEIVEETIGELIPRMMHCNSNQCLPLGG